MGDSKRLTPKELKELGNSPQLITQKYPLRDIFPQLFTARECLDSGVPLKNLLEVFKYRLIPIPPPLDIRMETNRAYDREGKKVFPNTRIMWTEMWYRSGFDLLRDWRLKREQHDVEENKKANEKRLLLSKSELWQLKGAVDPQKIKEAGYGVAVLRLAGFTPKDLLKRSLFDFSDLKATYTIKELRTDYTLRQLIKAKFSFEELRKGGVTASELKEAGVSFDTLLKETPYSTQELREAGFTANKFKTAGFTLREMKWVGFPLSEIIKLGWPVKELQNSYSMKEQALVAKELFSEEFSVAQLANLGLSALALNASRLFSIDDIFKCFKVEQLKAEGYDASILKRYFPLNKLKYAGFSEKELSLEYTDREKAHVKGNLFFGRNEPNKEDQSNTFETQNARWRPMS